MGQSVEDFSVVRHATDVYKWDESSVSSALDSAVIAGSGTVKSANAVVLLSLRFDFKSKSHLLL